MLFSITKESISNKFDREKIEEIDVGGIIITIVKDELFNEIKSHENFISIHECANVSNYLNSSNISFDRDKNVLRIFNSTISGTPLYYHINENGEFFCSSSISLMRSAGILIRENKIVLPEFFIYRFVMPPNTMFKDIFQLISGSELILKIINNKCKIINVKNYKPPDIELKKNGVDDIANDTLNILRESIKSAYGFRERVTVLLSGGLDSSILFKICQEELNVNETYSTGYSFEDSKNNLEKEYSLSASNLLNANHEYYENDDESFILGFIESIKKAEMPVHHLQSIPIFLLMKEIPNSKNFIISGLGADDIFGTMVQYINFKIENNLLLRTVAKYQDFFLFKKLMSINKNKQYKSVFENYEKSKFNLSDSNNLIWSLGAYGDQDWVCRYYGFTKEEILQNRYNQIRRFETKSVYNLQSLLMLFGSASTTQNIWHKLGASEGKMLFYPFLSKKNIDNAFSIDWDIKLKKHKNLLKIMAKKLKIPDEIINRPKSGFGINPEKWAIQGQIFERLIPLAKKSFEESQIRKMQSCDLKKAMIYWNILNYSLWKRLVINDEPMKTLIDELDQI